MSVVERSIIISVMYRDGSNYKSSEDQYFLNDIDISVKDLKEIIKDAVGFYEPVMVQDYGLRSVSPVENEFVPVHDGIDHAFCEITDVGGTNVTPTLIEEDENGDPVKISKVISLLKGEKRPEYGESQRKNEYLDECKQALKEAGYYVDNLWSLGDVTGKYEVSEKQALEILDSVMNNDYICSIINETIDDECRNEGLKEKETD